MTTLRASDWLDFLHRAGNVAHFWTADPQPTSTWFDCTPTARLAAWREAQAVNREQYVSINPSSRIPPHNASGNTNPKNISKQIVYIQCINVLHTEFDGKDQCRDGENFYDDPTSYKMMALAHVRDLPYRPTLIVDSGGGYHCVPLSTEILTANGWRKWDEVQAGDQVVGYDTNTETLTWTVVTGKIVKENDPLVRVHNNNFSAICTPEHNWVTHVKTGHQGEKLLKNQLTKAKDISRRRHKIVISAPFITESNYLPISEHEATILGWIISDGYIKPYDAAIITQSEKKYASTIRQLLKDIPHTENNYDKDTPDFVTWYIGNGWMRDLLQRSGLTHKSLNKNSWSQFVLKLSPACRKAFLTAAFQGDGTLNHGAWCMVQQQGDKADALNLAIFLEGNAPRISGKCASRPESQTRVTRSGHGFASWNIQVDDAGQGAVWCPKTELGTWVMRQGDTICITGNCYWYLTDPMFITDSNRQSVIDTQHWFVRMNGGDQGVSDIARVYRVLGTRNCKPGWGGNNPLVQAIEYDSNRLYDYRLLSEAAGEWRQEHLPPAPPPVNMRVTPCPKRDITGGTVRERYNESVDLVALLVSHGYRVQYRAGRLVSMIRPGGEKHSLTAYPPDGKRPAVVKAHNTADPLYKEAGGHDAYGVMMMLEHGGDWKAAHIAAKKAVGLWEETSKPRQQQRPSAPGLVAA